MEKREVPVSVIIPLYNSGEFLPECINSINSSSEIPSEIIAIDDCSTDDSYEIATKLAGTFSNLKVLKTPRNSGAALARKAGFQAAKEELVAIVDADDFVEDGAIPDAYKRMNESIDLCIWEMWKYEVDGSKFKHKANPEKFPLTGDEALLLSFGQWRVHPLGVARKKLYLEAYKSLDIDSYNSDELITRTLFRNSRKITGSNKKYFYRTNYKSTTLSISDKHLTFLRSQLWLFKLALATKGAPASNIIKHGIESAYDFYKNRHNYSRKALNTELTTFVKTAASIPMFWPHVFSMPKHAAIFILLAKYSFFP
jgi:glycosyltransferase involved in cell wall biosynthesis